MKAVVQEIRLDAAAAQQREQQAKHQRNGKAGGCRL